MAQDGLRIKVCQALLETRVIENQVRRFSVEAIFEIDIYSELKIGMISCVATFGASTQRKRDGLGAKQSQPHCKRVPKAPMRLRPSLMLRRQGVEP